MMQPIRPHDASGIYRRQLTQAEAADAAASNRRAGLSGAPGRRTDQVNLSEGAREFARIMDAVQQTAESRPDRVQELRSRIESGSYVVDHTGLAALLVDRGVTS